jgi:cytoskeletal protein CcmA (bactofilin family)
MAMFSTRKSEPSTPVRSTEPARAESSSNGSGSSRPGGLLSRGVSIKGTIKFSDELLFDGEVDGKIDSTGTLTIGEHASVRGDVRARSIKVRGSVEGNIFASERCELQAGCSLHGDIEAPRLVVDENATFCGSAKVAQQS